MESRVRAFYASWGVSVKSEDGMRTIAEEISASSAALEAFNKKLRARYKGTDISSTHQEIEAMRHAMIQESSSLAKSITFDHRFCVAPMVCVCAKMFASITACLPYCVLPRNVLLLNARSPFLACYLPPFLPHTLTHSLTYSLTHSLSDSPPLSPFPSLPLPLSRRR